MGLTGDFDKLARLGANVKRLGQVEGSAQKLIASAAIAQIKVVVREEFAFGRGPYGAWKRTVRGRSALISSKLPTTLRGTIIPGGARFEFRNDWLRAHHEGHVFPQRNSTGQSLYFKSGRLTSAAKYAKAVESYTAKRVGRHYRASVRGQKAPKDLKRNFSSKLLAPHTIGARTLPARPIYPTGSPPQRWADALNTGARLAMLDWYAKATSE